MVNKGPISAPIQGVPRWALPPSAPAPSPIDFSKLLDKLLPPPDGEDMARMRTGIVDAVNADGTVDVGISGLVVPGVARLDGAVVYPDQTVNIIVWRGGILVIGATATAGGQGGTLGLRKSTAGTTLTTTTALKDGGTGDIAFTAVSGHRYQISYRGRMTGNTVDTSGDIQIRDGGGSSPTNASTILDAAHNYLGSSTSQGQSNAVVDAIVDCPTDIAAGTHTVALFYVRTGAAGSVSMTQSTGQFRKLWVQDLGPIYN